MARLMAWWIALGVYVTALREPVTCCGALSSRGHLLVWSYLDLEGKAHSPPGQLVRAESAAA